MFNFLKFRKADKQYGTGWLGDKPDPIKSYQANEIFKSYPDVTWKEKSQSEWRKFLPIRNQNGSSGCVSFTVSLMLGIENFLEEGKFIALSPRMIYGRGFEPEGGMFYTKGFTLGNTIGSVPDILLPSDAKNEASLRFLEDERESDRLVAQTYRGGAFMYLPQNIDAIAGIISTGKAIGLGIRFDPGGFSNGEVILKENGQYGHAITGVDFTVWKNQKAIVFQNSWGDSWGFNGLGILTEGQLITGGFSVAAMYQNLQNAPSTGKKIQFKILIPLLKVGDRGAEVVKLQSMLQYLGFFPANQDCTGFYGGITRQAVKDFERKNNLPEDGIANQDIIIKLTNAYNAI